MFGSPLPSVVGTRAHVLFTLFVFVCVQWGPSNSHIVLCFLRVVYPMYSLTSLSSFITTVCFVLLMFMFYYCYWYVFMHTGVQHDFHITRRSGRLTVSRRVSLEEQEPEFNLLWCSFCSMCSFLSSVLQIIVCPFSFILTIILYDLRLLIVLYALTI